MRFLRLSLLLSISLLFGCANQQVQEAHQLPTPTKDKALLYFYREGKFEGSGSVYHIIESGHELGILPNATFFYLFVTPGQHIYEAHFFLQHPVQARLIAKAGQTYYLKTDAYVGGISANITLNIMNEDEGRSALDHLHLKEPLARR